MMNKFFLAVLVLVNSISITKVTSIEDKKLQKNIFHQVHVHVQDTVNKIFGLLHLSVNFTREYKNYVLLSMHASMKSITKEIYQELRKIKKIAKFKSKNKPKEGHYNLEKMIGLVIDDMLTIGNKTLSNQTTVIAKKLALTSVEIPDNFTESINFLKEYLYKVKGSEIFGFESPVQKVKQFYEHHKLRAKKDFKTWQAPNSTGDFNETLTRRILGGNPVKIKKFPFVASVHVLGDFNCAASIVSKEWALTAAICLLIAYKDEHFIRNNPNAITIRTGSDYIEHLGQVCTISKIVFHPDYDPETLRNNLAMIKFSYKFHLKTKSRKIKKVAYLGFLRRRMPQSIKNVLLLGWGSQDSHLSFSFNRLLSTSLDIYDFERCKKVYSSKYVTESNFCAGFKTKGSGACQRDAGGPGIVDSILVGVVSFGPSVCGTPDAPTVFTNVDLYTQWIDDVVEGKYHVITSKDPSTINPDTKQNTFRHQNKRYRTDLNIPKTQYPEAIRVVSELLNNLIAGQALDSIAYNESNEDMSDSEDSGIVVELDDESSDEENNLLKDAQKTTSHKINPSGLLSRTHLSKDDPYFIAINNLQDQLGLDKLMNSIHIDPDNNKKQPVFKVTTDKYWKRYGIPKLDHPLQSFHEELESLQMSESSETDNYESDSENGMSIEVPSGMATEFALKDMETTRFLTLLPITPAAEVEAILKRKQEKLLDQQRTVQSSETTRKETTPNQRMSDVPSYLGYGQSKPWRYDNRNLLVRNRAVLSDSMSWEKPNFSNDTQVVKESLSEDYEDIQTDKNNANNIIMKKPKDDDTSENFENTNELQNLAKQIRAELQVDSSEFEYTNNKSLPTNATINMNPVKINSEEKFNFTKDNTENNSESNTKNNTQNNTQNNTKNNTEINTEPNIENKIENNTESNTSNLAHNNENNITTKLNKNELPLEHLQIDDAGRNYTDSQIKAESNVSLHIGKEKQLVSVVQTVDDKLHADRKNFRVDDNLPDYEKVDVDEQLLDYINV